MQNNNILENTLVEFSYILGGAVLDRVSPINDLGVIMDEKMNFSEHIDVMVGKAFAMLGFIRKLSLEFRDPFTLRSLYTSLVRPKLEDASCVWSQFYDVRLSNMLCVVWVGRIFMICHRMYELRCALLRLDTLMKRCSIARIMFIFDILSGRMNSPNLLSALDFNTPRYRNRGSDDFDPQTDSVSLPNSENIHGWI
jgi:hypothetical protein